MSNQQRRQFLNYSSILQQRLSEHISHFTSCIKQSQIAPSLPNNSTPNNILNNISNNTPNNISNNISNNIVNNNCMIVTHNPQYLLKQQNIMIQNNPHLNTYTKILSQCMDIWLQLLQNDNIQSINNNIIINQSITLTYIYNRLIHDININMTVSQKQQRVQQFADIYIGQQNIKYVVSILNLIATQIIDCFQYGRQYMKQLIQQLVQVIKKSRIVNSMLVFAMLKDINMKVQLKMRQIINSFYIKPYSQNSIERLIKYTIKNFDGANLIVAYNQKPTIYTQQQQQLYYQINTQQLLNKLKIANMYNTAMMQIQSENGFIGILVMRNQDNPQQNIIIKVDNNHRLFAINGKALQSKCRLLRTEEINNDLRYQQLVKLQSMYGFNMNRYKADIENQVNYANYNSSGIGKSLADINQYESYNQFAKDFTKRVALEGPIRHLMVSMPIVNYFVIAGGLGYQFYKIANRRATSGTHKMKKLGQTGARMGSGFVGAFIGMTVGQIIIPVPVLGAFVGGVVGGVIFQTGGRKFTGFLQRRSFKKDIAYLKQTIINQQYWQSNPSILKQLGIKQQYFSKVTNQTNNPTFINYNSDIWMTAICLCAVCHYESQRYNEHTLNKIKQSNDKQKQQKNMITQQQLFANQNDFKPQFDIVKIVQFLGRSRFSLFDNFQSLDGLADHIIPN